MVMPPEGAQVLPSEGYDRMRRSMEQALSMVMTRRWSGRLLYLPDFVVFCVRLFADPRTSAGRRLMAGTAIGYLVLPLDAVPDVLPGLGLLDDVIFLALAVRQLLNESDPAVLAELWPNPDVEPLQATRRVLDHAAQWLPQGLHRRFTARRWF